MFYTQLIKGTLQYTPEECPHCPTHRQNFFNHRVKETKSQLKSDSQSQHGIGKDEMLLETPTTTKGRSKVKLRKTNLTCQF